MQAEHEGGAEQPTSQALAAAALAPAHAGAFDVGTDRASFVQQALGGSFVVDYVWKLE